MNVRMNVRALFSTSVLALLLLTGCEGANYPLGDASESMVDRQFLGSWAHTPSGDDAKSYVNLMAFNDHEYLGFAWDAGSETEMSIMAVYSTVVNETSIATLHVLGEESVENDYFFVKYVLSSDGELVMQTINENQYKEMDLLKSATALQEYFEEHIDDPDFFDDEVVVYKKLAESVWPWPAGYPNFGK